MIHKMIVKMGLWNSKVAFNLINYKTIEINSENAAF